MTQPQRTRFKHHHLKMGGAVLLKMAAAAKRIMNLHTPPLINPFHDGVQAWMHGDSANKIDAP